LASGDRADHPGRNPGAGQRTAARRFRCLKRVFHEGDEHEGIELAFGGEGHRIDFAELVGASVWLYPQTDVFADLATARERDRGDVRFGVSETTVVDLDTRRPGLTFFHT